MKLNKTTIILFILSICVLFIPTHVQGAQRINSHTGKIDFGVAGPTANTSTDNALARWDGTGGTTLQDSAVTVADTSGNMTFPDNAWIGLGSAAGRLEFDDQATDEVNILDANVGIGTATPATLLHLLGTTEQLRIGNTAAAYMSFTEGSNGVLTIQPSGAISGTSGVWLYDDVGALITIFNRDSGVDIRKSVVIGGPAQSANLLRVQRAAGSTNIFHVDGVGTVGGDVATGLKLMSEPAGSGIKLDATSTGTNEDMIINAKGSGDIILQNTATGNVGIGNTAPAGKFVVEMPATQTIAAGNTITADGCGTVKRVTAAGAVTTDTTNTFTAPAAANSGCILHVLNVGSFNITLDNNANFKSPGGADVVMTPDDAIVVASTGASGAWYAMTALVAN